MRTLFSSAQLRGTAAAVSEAVFVYDQTEKSPAEPIYEITDGISDPNGLHVVAPAK